MDETTKPISKVNRLFKLAQMTKPSARFWRTNQIPFQVESPAHELGKSPNENIAESGQPALQVFLYKGVVGEEWIGAAYSVYFFGLAGGEDFLGIEAPGAFQKALAAQDFVDTGYDTGKAVGAVEYRGVGVCEFFGVG
jgi:hypothetical protein